MSCSSQIDWLSLSSCLGFCVVGAAAVAMCLGWCFPPLYVGGSGRDAMPIGRVGTCGTGMHTVKTKPMCPTVKHLDTVVGDDMQCSTALGAWHRCSHLSGADGAGGIGAVQGRFITSVILSDVHCSIGTVVAKLRHCELAEAFFVFVSEVNSKLDQSLVGNGSDMPGVAGSGEDTGQFE